MVGSSGEKREVSKIYGVSEDGSLPFAKAVKACLGSLVSKRNNTHATGRQTSSERPIDISEREGGYIPLLSSASPDSMRTLACYLEGETWRKKGS